MFGSLTDPIMLRKLSTSSFLSRALIVTRTWPSWTAVATVNFPWSPEGRIDQRTIWLTSLA